MPDILDAAQQQINNAAGKTTATQTPPADGGPPVGENPVPPEPPPSLPQTDNTVTPGAPPMEPPLGQSVAQPDPIPAPVAPPSELSPLPPLPTETKPEETLIVPPPPGGDAPLPPPITPKKAAGKGIIAAVLLLLLVALPAGVYFVSNSKQIADLRGRAAGSCTTPDFCGTRQECTDGGASAGSRLDCNVGEYCCTVPVATPTPTPGITDNCTPGHPDRYCAQRAECLGNGDTVITGVTCGAGGTVCCGPGPGQSSPTPNPQGTPDRRCESNGGECWSTTYLCSAGGGGYTQYSCPNNQKCIKEGINCVAPTSTPPSSTSGATPPPAGQCPTSGGSVPCTPGDPNACGGATCQAQNWSCTLGTNGQYFCNQHGNNLCPGGTCTGVNAYKCPNGLTNGECHQSLQTMGTYPGAWQSGITYTNGCGQVDQVCVGGSNNGLGCGDFQVVDMNCSSTSTPTPPQSSNTPTTIAGQCTAIKIYNTQGQDITQAILNGTSGVQRGDTISLAVVGTNATKGRFRVNGGTFQESSAQNNRGEYTLSFTIPVQPIVNSFTAEAEVFIGGQWK